MNWPPKSGLDQGTKEFESGSERASGAEEVSAGAIVAVESSRKVADSVAVPIVDGLTGGVSVAAKVAVIGPPVIVEGLGPSVCGLEAAIRIVPFGITVTESVPPPVRTGPEPLAGLGLGE